MKHNLHGAQSLDLFILHVYHLGIFLWNQFSSSPPFSPSGFTFSGSGARTGSKTCECFFMGIVVFFNLVIVWDRIACTPGWPHIHYADKTAKLLVLLPLPSKCQHYRPAQIQTCHHFVPLWLMSLLLPANL